MGGPGQEDQVSPAQQCQHHMDGRLVGAMSQGLGFGSRAGADQWVPTSLAKHP